MRVPKGLATRLVLSRGRQGIRGATSVCLTESACKVPHLRFTPFHPETVSDKAFHIAERDVVTWDQVKPGIYIWLGLDGVGFDSSKWIGAEWTQELRVQWGDRVEEK